MALIVADKVQETSTTTGTGAYTLLGATTAHRAASTVCANGDTFTYYAEAIDANERPTGAWETGLGTWGTGNILTRTTIYASSNAGAAVSWAAGTKRIGLGLVANAALGPTTIVGNISATNLSGTNTGDNATNTNYASDYRAANFVAGTNYLTPTGSAASLTSFPTLNQNTTGSAGLTVAAATFTTTGGAVAGTTFNGSTARTIDYTTVGAAASGHNHSGVYQPVDADLTAIAALVGTTGLLKKTAADTWTLDTAAYTTNVGTVTSVTAGNGMTQSGTSTVNPTLDIVSHAGSAGTIGTINVSADAIGVNLGTTSTTAYPGNNPSGFTTNTGTVTGVTATAPVASSGGTAPVISMTALSGTVSGYVTTQGASSTAVFLNGNGAWSTPPNTWTALTGTVSGYVTTQGASNTAVWLNGNGAWSVPTAAQVGAIATGGTAGAVTNAATFNNAGTGAVSGTTYNGSAAQTISYNTIGASPLAGSASLTTTGTVTSGTWSGSFGAVSGANLTTLNASNLSSGTVGTARLGSGTADTTTYLRGDSTWQTIASGTWVKKTTTYTAVAGDLLIADTTAGVFTITLPATPTAGQAVTIVDGGNWKINNLTLARNGSTIESLAEDITIDLGGLRLDVIYDGTTWNVVSSATAAELPDQTGNSGKYLITDGTIVSWQNGGVTASDDTTTNATYYPAIFTTTSGTQTAVKVSSTKLYFNPSTGTLNATTFNSLSDRNLKENIIPLVASIDDVNPVEFTWKDTGVKSFGVIAQDLETVFPEMVETNDAGIKSVSYMQLIPILIQEIKSLKEQVKNLNSR